MSTKKLSNLFGLVKTSKKKDQSPDYDAMSPNWDSSEIKDLTSGYELSTHRRGPHRPDRRNYKTSPDFHKAVQLYQKNKQTAQSYKETIKDHIKNDHFARHAPFMLRETDPRYYSKRRAIALLQNAARAKKSKRLKRRKSKTRLEKPSNKRKPKKRKATRKK